MMKKPFAWTGLICAGLIVSGCSGSLSAINLSETRGTPGGAVSLELVEARRSAGEGVVAINEQHAGARPPDEVARQCLGLPDDGGQELSVTSIVLTAYGALQKAVTNVIAAEVAEKAKRFRQPYSAMLRVPALTVPANDGERQLCLRLLRKDDAGAVLSDILLRVNKAGENAIFVEKAYIDLPKFAASASPRDGVLTVRVAASLGMSVINSDGALGDAPRVDFNVPVISTRYSVREGGTVLKKDGRVDSPLLPAPKGKPATLVLSVVETGAGAETFEGFSDDFAANAKVVGDTLGGILSDVLTQ